MGSKRRRARAAQAQPRPQVRVEPIRRDPPGLIHSCAMHEAGHAVAAVVLGFKLNGVDLKLRPLPNGTSGGLTHVEVRIDDCSGKGEDAAMPYMIQAIIGGVAEMALHNNLDAMEEATIGDWAIARRTAAIAICGTVDPDAQVANWGRIDRFNTAAYEATHRFWEEHREAIINVAEALVERRALTGAEVAMLVEASKVTADEPPAG